MADEPVFLQDGFIAVHADDVVGDFAGAVEGEIAALMVVANFMVETPAGELQFAKGRHLRRSTGGNHDRITAVHVAGADLYIGHDALRPFALGGLIGDVVLGFDDLLPELHELSGIFDGKRNLGGAAQDQLIAGEFSPRRGALFDLNPFGVVILAEDK